jgi:hypothetical protein
MVSAILGAAKKSIQLSHNACVYPHEGLHWNSAFHSRNDSKDRDCIWLGRVTDYLRTLSY